MSSFDMNLDRCEKISTILIGILGLIATLYVTLTVIIPGDKRDQLKTCKYEQNKSSNLIKDNPEMNTDELVKSLNKACVQDDEASRSYLSKEQSNAQLAAQTERITRKKQSTEQGVTDDAAKIMGFVSLGPEFNYQKSNFLDFTTGEKAVKIVKKLKVGAILKARWDVNLRENKENTELGNNKSLLLIRNDECVRLEEKPTKTIRGKWWLEVSLVACPVVRN